MKTKRSREWESKEKLGGRTVVWVDLMEKVAFQEGPEPCQLRLEMHVMPDKVWRAEGSRVTGGAGAAGEVEVKVRLAQPTVTSESSLCRQSGNPCWIWPNN